MRHHDRSRSRRAGMEVLPIDTSRRQRTAGSWKRAARKRTECPCDSVGAAAFLRMGSSGWCFWASGILSVLLGFERVLDGC